MIRIAGFFFLFCLILLVQSTTCDCWTKVRVKYDSVLLVNDTHARGTLGDNFLSLDEAVKLANGSLSLDALSQKEAHCVSGLPGKMSSDHIKVLLGNGAVIRPDVPQISGEPVVSFLVGNDRDYLEGGGVIIQEGSDKEFGERTGMIIKSSKVRVQGFEFRGLRYGIIVTSDFFPGITGVTIERNVFRNIQNGVIANASTFDAGAIRKLSIKRNYFFPHGETANSIIIQGAVPQYDGQEISGSVIEELTIQSNRIHGGFGGILIIGGMAQIGTRVHGVKIRDIVIEKNRIEGVYDISIGVVGGMSSSGGSAKNITIDGVSVRFNRIDVFDSPGTPIWAAAGATVFEGPGGKVSGNVFRRLNIIANRVNGIGSDCVGILVSAGHIELTDGLATENELFDVAIRKNRVCACENGVAIIAGVAAASAGTVDGNLIHQAIVSGNWLRSNSQGIIIDSGLGVESTAISTPYIPSPAFVTSNCVKEIIITRNRVYGNETGLNFIGGTSVESPDVVTNNRVESVSILCNALRLNEINCLVNDNLVVGDEGGQAFDNAALVTCE